MAISIIHPFHSDIPDGGDITIVQPSNWNADHTITGTLAPGNGGTGGTWGWHEAVGVYDYQIALVPDATALSVPPQSGQGAYAIAIGVAAGNTDQGSNSVAIGYYAGNNTQGANSVAVGYGCGNITQGTGSVAIGQQAGEDSQGNYAVAIGFGAGQTSQPASSIAINGTSTALNPATAGFFVTPVANGGTSGLPGGFKQVAYNPTTGEFKYYA